MHRTLGGAREALRRAPAHLAKTANGQAQGFGSRFSSRMRCRHACDALRREPISYSGFPVSILVYGGFSHTLGDGGTARAKPRQEPHRVDETAQDETVVLHILHHG